MYIVDSIDYRLLSQKLDELKDKIQSALVDRVVTDFIDISTPLKQFTDAVLAPEGNIIIEHKSMFLMGNVGFLLDRLAYSVNFDII